MGHPPIIGDPGRFCQSEQQARASPDGAAYSYADAAGLLPGSSYTYTLEVVDLSGAAKVAGRATVVHRLPARRWMPLAF